jgi:hypothetical protein
MSSNDEPAKIGGSGSTLSALVSRFIGVETGENGIPRVRLNIVGLLLTSVGTVILSITTGIGSVIDGFASAAVNLFVGLAGFLLRWLDLNFSLPRVVDAALADAQAQLAQFGPLGSVAAVAIVGLTAYAVAWGVRQVVE